VLLRPGSPSEVDVIVRFPELMPGSLKEEVQDLLFSKHFEMPNLPHVATQALAMAQDEKSTSASLAELICKDQSLATNLLRIAN
jgi:HD-like signal output (HDOD) protein